MNHAQALDALNLIERSFAVSDLEYCGVPIWPILRIQLGAELLANDVLDISNAVSSKTPPLDLQSLKGYFKASFKDGKSEARFTRSSDVLFLGDQLSRTLLEGSQYDRLCDPLADLYENSGYRTIQFEPLISFDRFPRHRQSCLLSRATMEIAANRFRVPRHSRYPAMDRHLLQEVYQSIEDISGQPVRHTISSLLERVANCSRNASIWEAILERVDPKIVYLVQYYGDMGWALCLACRRRGIPTAELPHGRQDTSHSAYSRWLNAPSDGYSILPKVFWTWSSFEAKVIDDWSHSLQPQVHSSFIGGNPFLEAWKQGVLTLPQLPPKNDPDSLDVLATPEFCCYAIDPILETIAQAPPNWRWFLRMHPSEYNRREELRDRISQAGIENAEIDFATDEPLYGLLSQVDALFTHFSSTILEAKALGIPSVSFTPISEKLFECEARSGWLSIAEGPDACIAALQRYAQDEIAREPRPVSGTPWNLKDAIHSLHETLSVDLPIP